MALSFSYITAWITFRVSYKDIYKKRAPLAIIGAPQLSIYFYTAMPTPLLANLCPLMSKLYRSRLSFVTVLEASEFRKNYLYGRTLI